MCSTDESSKVIDESSTGEKGIGFKSVFGIATEVHIQSGIWSFGFHHEAHDDGIGMVTPEWQMPKQIFSNELKSVGTQLTLQYTHLDEYARASLYQKLKKFISYHSQFSSETEEGCYYYQ